MVSHGRRLALTDNQPFLLGDRRLWSVMCVESEGKLFSEVKQ